ncbi:MAG: YHYH protein [Bacteroidia bacterium]
MIKKFVVALFAFVNLAWAQTSPGVTSWIINNSGVTGRHYMSGNSTPIVDTAQANVQLVRYSTNNAYINASGVPSYIIGPYLDGNPSNASNNDHLFQVPLNPVENTGTKTATNPGIIGVFINGVPIYDWRDAQSYNNQGIWNRDAVVNERDGFDCAKGHPSPIFSGGRPGPGGGGTLAGGTYHHHQNPSAFDLDKLVISTVCNTYPADGLYVLDSTRHSPLLGFAFDGFPVYGAYAYSNTNGTGGIRRMESSYQKRNISVRTHYADGTNVTNGPAVSITYPLGTYKEDYEFITGSGDLDEYNGRFSITPEYPSGTYAYYTTVDSNWNSQFPYIIGPDAYYGIVSGGEVNAITEAVQIYSPILPLELVSFYASPMDNHGVLLQWITERESDFNHFEIERSTDGISYALIGSIKGEGTESKGATYEYTDQSGGQTLMHYRLKLVDHDGNFSYSKIVMNTGESVPSKIVKVYPNPASEFIAIQVGSLIQSTVEVSLYYLNGKLIQTKQIYPGSTFCYFDVQTLYEGMYIIKIRDGAEMDVYKVNVRH